MADTVTPKPDPLAATILSLTCLFGPTVFAAEEAAPPDEPPLGKQQAVFDRLNVLEAWEITKGDPDVLVGVIDGGYDFYHPDLKGQLIPGYYYAGGFHTSSFTSLMPGGMA